MTRDIHGYAVVDSGFPPWGHQFPGGIPAYDFDQFFQKLHEIEKILVLGGGGGIPVPPLDPPMGM